MSGFSPAFEGLPPFGDEGSRLAKEAQDRKRQDEIFELFGYRPASPTVAATDDDATPTGRTAPITDKLNSWHHDLTGQLALPGNLQSSLQEQREREQIFINRCNTLLRSRGLFKFFDELNDQEDMAASMSPSTSPRLPSPPPIPEVQIGPQSPSINPTSGPPEIRDPSAVSAGATDRIRPGTKAADMATGPPLVPLEEIDSPFALQTYLKALWHHYTTGPKKTTQPITRETALEIVNPPKGVDRSLWLYELCRFVVQKLNDLIVGFISDRPPCTADTCPEMRASEWQYLCAVHDPPKSCCAIDYSCHTLDWAANTLTSQKHFPSRLTLGSEGSGGKQAAERQITNIFRRAYRIFAHAWFQHRQVFWSLEGKTGHYTLFKTVCDVYTLIPTENYTIPPEAEGLVTSSSDIQVPPAPVTIMKKPAGGDEQKKEEDDTNTTISTGATTRRHKHTPSTGSVVTVIQEGDEDEAEPESQPMVRETPATQKPGVTGLRDPLSGDDGEDEKATKSAEPSPETAVDDFTISEPAIEEGDKGDDPKPQAEDEVSHDEEKGHEETVEQ